MAGYHFSREPVDVQFVKTKNRLIQTQIPAPGSVEILEKLDKYESRSMHGQLPLVWDRAVGHNIYDHADNKWIDFTSMIFVANVGHANERVISGVEAAIRKPILGCYAYPNKIRAEYLEKLVQFAGNSKKHFFYLLEQRRQRQHLN